MRHQTPVTISCFIPFRIPILRRYKRPACPSGPSSKRKSSSGGIWPPPEAPQVAAPAPSSASPDPTPTRCLRLPAAASRTLEQRTWADVNPSWMRRRLIPAAPAALPSIPPSPKWNQKLISKVMNELQFRYRMNNVMFDLDQDRSWR